MSWQPWEVVWSPSTQRQLTRLSNQDQERVIEAMERFAATGRGDVRQMEGSRRQWRLRVGTIRIVFVFDQEARQIIVMRVDRRDAVYR
jgi:mRNA interferase RelE/StbE